MQRLLAVCAMAVLVLAGCSKKAQVPPITEWDQFNDQFFRVTFMMPKGWEVQKEPTRVTVTSSREAMDKFFDPYSKSAVGAQLVVSGARADSVTTLDAIVEDYKKDLTESGYAITSETRIMIDSVPAVEFQYGGRYDSQTSLKSVRAIAYKDTTIYYVQFGGFNEYFEPYRSVYDSALHSLLLPKPIVHDKAVDPSIPVEQMDKYSDDAVEFMYPSNFTTTVGKPEKEVLFTVTIKGYRQDCYIQIDQRPAKGLKLDKVVEQNLKNFKGAGKSSNATVSGEAAKVVSYVPARGIDGRVYFVVKNDKFYRVIVVNATAVKKDFLPSLEKTVASLRLK